jgi:hypothetical protein
MNGTTGRLKIKSDYTAKKTHTCSVKKISKARGTIFEAFD